MIRLRKLQKNELDDYKYWKLPVHEYHKFNDPYFKKRSKQEVEDLIEKYKTQIPENIKIISNEKNQIIGEVNWYWKSKETLWLEVGVVIFDKEFWGQGIGYEALYKWIHEIFEEKPEIIRIGLTTWSGNKRMMQLAKKLKLKEEARYRKARIVDGQYFDSVSYGILRDEWEKIKRIQNDSIDF